MERYFNEDDLLKHLELSIKSWSRDCNSNAPKMVLAYKDVVERIKLLPTADVAPRAELAAQIFAEIREKGKFADPCVEHIFLSLDELAEIEKKYK